MRRWYRGARTYIPEDRWQQCVADAQPFLAAWGEQAQALGWTSRDLFGLHTVPANPHPTYSRLSRYDCTGLVWLLQGKPVIALTSDHRRDQEPHRQRHRLSPV